MLLKPLIILLVVLIPLGAIAFWLASPLPMPPVQKMEQSIPDDHIPR